MTSRSDDGTVRAEVMRLHLLLRATPRTVLPGGLPAVEIAAGIVLLWIGSFGVVGELGRELDHIAVGITKKLLRRGRDSHRLRNIVSQ
jgi:hypothetical protein